MLLKMISAAAIALAVSGSAFAQTSSTSNAAAAPRLEDRTMMAPFYSDEGMTELRGAGEFDAAFKNLSSQDREMIMTECENVNTQRTTFCDQFKERNGRM